MPTFIESSKGNWAPIAGDNPTAEQIGVGCLQRIAAATEAMAQNYKNLQNERDRYEKWYRDELKTTARLQKSNAALRGHIKRLKNKAI